MSHPFSLGVALALAVAAGALEAAAQPAPPSPLSTPTVPRQAWADKDGLVNLKPLTGPIPAAQLADRLSIQDVFARWGIAYDEGRADVVRTLFTADGTYQVVQGAYKPGGEVVGPDAIAAVVVNALKQQGDQRRHAISNIVIDRLTDHEATAIAYGVVVVAADGLSLGATVIYSADLRREADGAWRFSRFVIGMDHYAGRPPRTPR